jgi:hypothetical protein
MLETLLDHMIVLTIPLNKDSSLDSVFIKSVESLLLYLNQKGEIKRVNPQDLQLIEKILNTFFLIVHDKPMTVTANLSLQCLMVPSSFKPGCLRSLAHDEPSNLVDRHETVRQHNFVLGSRCCYEEAASLVKDHNEFTPGLWPPRALIILREGNHDAVGVFDDRCGRMLDPCHENSNGNLQVRS